MDGEAERAANAETAKSDCKLLHDYGKTSLAGKRGKSMGRRIPVDLRTRQAKVFTREWDLEEFRL